MSQDKNNNNKSQQQYYGDWCEFHAQVTLALYETTK